MEFNVPAYLDNDTSVKEIKDYNKYLSTGVLLDEEILYLLIVGEFVNRNKNKVSYLHTLGLDDFNYITQFLNGIRKLFITPHIFTKFIHLLWENIDNNTDYEEIIKIFEMYKDFIKEEHLDKEFLFGEQNFKTKKWDLINSSLILTSQKFQHNVILTCRGKTKSICNSSGCLVIYYENIKSAYLTKLYS